MERKNLPPFWVVFGAGVVLLASLGFVVASLGKSTSSPMATSVLATRVPVATPASISPLPTTELVPQSPLPPVALEAAPDFTLGWDDGNTFTLLEQLAQGPVVLVFFQKCG